MASLFYVQRSVAPDRQEGVEMFAANLVDASKDHYGVIRMTMAP